MNKQKLKAILLMILSAFCFALQQIFVKQSSGQIPIFEQIFVRNFISIAVVMFTALRLKPDLRAELKSGGLLLWARSVIGFLGIIVYFYASSHARQADVAVINRLSPIFITIMAAVLLHEKITRVKLAAILLCMGGAYVAMRPAFDSDPLPLLAALGTAVIGSITYTLIALCKGKASATTIVLHYSIVCALLSGIMCLPSFVVPTPINLLRLLGIGICASSGQLFLSFAYTHAPASEISIYDYTGVIFSAVLGFLAFGESLTKTIVSGGALIFAGVLILFLVNRKQPA